MNSEEILKHFTITEEEIESDCKDLENDNFENWDMDNWHYVDQVHSKQKMKTLSFSVPVTTVITLENIANKEHVSKSEFLRRAVNRELLLSSNK